MPSDPSLMASTSVWIKRKTFHGVHEHIVQFCNVLFLISPDMMSQTSCLVLSVDWGYEVIAGQEGP